MFKKLIKLGVTSKKILWFFTLPILLGSFLFTTTFLNHLIFYISWFIFVSLVMFLNFSFGVAAQKHKKGLD